MLKQHRLLTLLAMTGLLALLHACGGNDSNGGTNPGDAGTSSHPDATVSNTDAGVQEPGTPVGSCAIADAQVPVCTDYSNLSAAVTVAAIRSACTSSANATWSDTGCNRANAIGGCNIPAGGAYTQVVWYMMGGATTVQAGQAACTQLHGTWITP